MSYQGLFRDGKSARQPDYLYVSITKSALEIVFSGRITGYGKRALGFTQLMHNEEEDSGSKNIRAKSGYSPLTAIYILTLVWHRLFPGRSAESQRRAQHVLY